MMSKERHIHVVAIVLNAGEEFHESLFSSFTADAAKEVVQRALTKIAEALPLEKVPLL